MDIDFSGLTPTPEEVPDLIREADACGLDARVERFRYLLTVLDLQGAYVDPLSKAFSQEAQTCWINGSFIATIGVSQLALEESLRSFYREFRGGQGKIMKVQPPPEAPEKQKAQPKSCCQQPPTPKQKATVDMATFQDLILQAEHDGLLMEIQGKELNRLRREYRNPYYHPQDLPPRDKPTDPKAPLDPTAPDYQEQWEKRFNLKKAFATPSYLRLLLKIYEPGILGSGVEDDAREAITILMQLYPVIGRKLTQERPRFEREAVEAAYNEELAQKGLPPLEPRSIEILSEDAVPTPGSPEDSEAPTS